MISEVAGGALFGVVAAGGYFAPHALRYLVMPGVKRRLAQTRSVVLTYDDGPGTQLTPRLLDLLRDHDAKATFFMLSSRATRHPDVVDRLVAEGHEVGCHSHSHVSAWKALPWKAVADIEAGYRALSRWMPSDGPFRPPYGRLSLPTWLAIRKRRAPIHWWTVDSGDTYARLPEPNAVAEQVTRAHGGIVLLHDFDRDPARQDFVLRTTEAILRVARRDGLRVRRLSDVEGL